MDTKTYRNVDISFRKERIKEYQVQREKNMNTLMKYIQMVFTNTKEQVTQKIISSV